MANELGDRGKRNDMTNHLSHSATATGVKDVELEPNLDLKKFYHVSSLIAGHDSMLCQVDRHTQ